MVYGCLLGQWEIYFKCWNDYRHTGILACLTYRTDKIYNKTYYLHTTYITINARRSLAKPLK